MTRDEWQEAMKSQADNPDFGAIYADWCEEMVICGLRML